MGGKYNIGGGYDIVVFPGIGGHNSQRAQIFQKGTLRQLFSERALHERKMAENISRQYDGIDIEPVSYTHLDVYKRQSLSGGSGSVLGAVVGMLIIGVMTNGLDLLNVSSYYQKVIKGIIILVAVLSDRAKKK